MKVFVKFSVVVLILFIVGSVSVNSLEWNRGVLFYDNIFLKNSGDTATGDYTFDSGTLFINSASNRVGIGTSNPQEALEVAGNINVSGNIMLGSNLTLQGASNRFVGNILVDGNLTVLGDYINATVKTQYLNGSFLPEIDDIFTLGSSSKRWFNAFISKNLTVGANVLHVDGTNGRVGIDGRVGIGIMSPSAQLEINGAGSNGLALNVSNLLVVNKTSGNVGIGTTGPSEKLDVYGKISLAGTSDADSQINVKNALLINAGVTSKFRLLPYGNDIWFQNTVTGGNIYFAGLNGASLTGNVIFKTTGNVGIGTTKPNSHLHVNATGNSYIQVDVNKTTLAGTDCDADAERGRMIVDGTTSTLWVCFGADGWVAK